MLYTYESGDRGQPVILFLHGGGLSSRSWQPVIQRLAEFHCLAPDLPEQGRSKEVPYSVEGSARECLQILEQYAPGERAHVVALSLGGPVAFTLLRLAPEKIRSTLISGGSGQISPWMTRLAISMLWTYRFFKPENLVEMTMKQQGIPKEYADLAREDLLIGSNLEFARRYMRELSTWQLPARIDSPLQLVVGEKEPPATRDFARSYLKRFAAARGALVPGATHAWCLQKPDLFAAMVRAWVTQQALPPGFPALV